MLVLKAESEEHEEEWHIEVSCPYCAFTAPKWKYDKHEEMCALKPK